MGGISAPSIIPNVGQNTNRMNAGKQEPKTEAKPKAKPQIAPDEKEEGLAWVLGQTAISTGQTIISALDGFGRFGAGIMSSSTGLACSCEPTVLPEPIFDNDAGRTMGDGGGNVRLDGGTLIDSGLLIHDAGQIPDAGRPLPDASLPPDAATAQDGGIVDGCVEWLKTFNYTRNPEQFNTCNSLSSIKRVGDSNNYFAAGSLNCSPSYFLSLRSIEGEREAETDWSSTMWYMGGSAGVSSLDITEDNKILYTGGVYGNDAQSVFVIKTDLQGSSIWGNLSYSPFDCHGNSIRSSNGQILVGGGCNARGGAGAGFYLKINSQGEEQNVIDYYFGHYSQVVHVDTTIEGGSFVVGNTQQPFTPACESIVVSFWLVKYDSQGIETLRKVYSECEYANYEIISAIAINNGYMLFGNSLESAWLIKTDSDGNKIDQHTYFIEGQGFFAGSAKRNNRGGFIIAGKTVDNTGNTRICVIEIDSEGNMINYKMASFDENHGDLSVNAVETTTEQDNKIGSLIVGSYTTDQTNPAQPFDYGQRGFIKKFCPAP